MELPDDRQWQNEHNHIRDDVWEASPSYMCLDIIAAMASWDCFVPCVCDWGALPYTKGNVDDDCAHQDGANDIAHYPRFFINEDP